MLSEQPTIHPTARVVGSSLGVWTEIGQGCDIEESVIGDYSYAIRDVSIIYTTVGKFCSIASHVRINPGNHPMQRVSQHHFTYRAKQFGFDDEDDTDFFQWRRDNRCILGHDVWIGHNAIIMPGVIVGTGAVVGAGSVVTKNVQPYEVVAGVPARPLKKRFSERIIEKMLAIAWWDWDRELLAERFRDFRDTELFLEKYG